MGSLSPLATKTGLSIAVTRSSREWFGCPQAHTASYCASRACQSVSGSRSTVRAPNIRPRTSCPAARLPCEPVKKTLKYSSPEVSGLPTAPMTSGAQPCIPLAPCGAEEASTTLRTVEGRTSAISWARKLPIENPSRSTSPNVERVDEVDRVERHLRDRVRRPPTRRSHPLVVEGDHSTAAGERVDERGIPVVEVAAKVLQ